MFATTTAPFETTASDGWLAFVMDSTSTRFWWSFFKVKDDSIAGQIAPNLELWLADALSPFPWTDGLWVPFCSSEWCHLWGVFGAKGKFRQFAPKFQPFGPSQYNQDLLKPAKSKGVRRGTMFGLFPNLMVAILLPTQSLCKMFRIIGGTSCFRFDSIGIWFD